MYQMVCIDGVTKFQTPRGAVFLSVRQIKDGRWQVKPIPGIPKTYPTYEEALAAAHRKAADREDTHIDAVTRMAIQDLGGDVDLRDCQHALDHATRCIAAIRGVLEDAHHGSLSADDATECIWQALRDYDGDGDE